MTGTGVLWYHNLNCLTQQETTSQGWPARSFLVVSAIIVDGDVVVRHAEGLPREVEPAAAGEQLVGEGVTPHEGGCQADGLHAGRAVSRRDHPHAEGVGIEIIVIVPQSHQERDLSPRKYPPRNSLCFSSF